MHAVRSAARPKLSLAVPSAAKPSVPQLVIPGGTTSSSIRPFHVCASPSPLTPTARNTQLNQRSSSTLQVPTLYVTQPKKTVGKKVSFAESHHVELVSPCPQDYYGEYVKMSREERRWRPS